MTMPTPEWNGVEVRYRATHLDGSPVTGRLIITASEPRFTDDTGELAVAIFGAPIVIPIVAGTATFTLPATDDPDIEPNGFTYVIAEELDRGHRTTITNQPVLLEHVPTGIDLNRRFGLGA